MAFLNLFETYLTDQLAQLRKTKGEIFSHTIEAMQYSLAGGGKRFRPLLMGATAECLGENAERLLPAALSLEFIHTYSLIHDDLPSMDNDDYRRGKLASHRKYGEAQAILTGDALLTESVALFLKLKENAFESSRILEALELLYSKAGIAGMVGGQALDVRAKQPVTTLEQLEFIHRNKTGALIEAAVQVPLCLFSTPQGFSDSLTRYSQKLGVLFQLADDLADLNVTEEPSYRWFWTENEIRTQLELGSIECLNEIKCFGPKAEALVGLVKQICF